MHGGWWVHAVLPGPRTSENTIRYPRLPGFSSELESGPLSYSNLKNELPQVCTGLRSPCFETCDSKSLISGCLLSESVPSDLSSNISQSDEMIQREVRAQAQGTFQTLAHLW